MRLAIYSALGTTIALIGTAYLGVQYQFAQSQTSYYREKLATHSQEVPDTELMVTNLIDAFSVSPAPGTRTALVKGISAAILSQLPTREAREGFVLVLGLESRYGTIKRDTKGQIRSQVGALGMAQIMPQYGPELARECGLGNVAKDDLDRELVSLYLGACHFRVLYLRYGGNTALAMAAYNAGRGRITGKNASLPEETARYLARGVIARDSTAGGAP